MLLLLRVSGIDSIWNGCHLTFFRVEKLRFLVCVEIKTIESADCAFTEMDCWERKLVIILVHVSLLKFAGQQYTLSNFHNHTLSRWLLIPARPLRGDHLQRWREDNHECKCWIPCGLSNKDNSRLTCGTMRWFPEWQFSHRSAAWVITWSLLQLLQCNQRLSVGVQSLVQPKLLRLR